MSTKNKILDAAEKLFATQGFNGTSLREITSQAEVNLAAVNYHFGSKKELIKSVMSRYMNELSPRLELSLVNICEQDDLTLLEVFSAFIEPLLSLNEFKENGTSNFLQLLGRGYSDSQGFLRWFLTTQYPGVINNFVKAVQKAYPELTAEEMFWRLHFTMGTVVFTMSSSDALIDIAKSDFDRNMDIAGVIKQVIPYVAAGVAAPLL
ncbi:MAG: AcrR family transcriptional regulator [Colwellia sp.]|jgi:AcrR family transcriptional regulator|uniref:TetR/AcrR family transcriptional regulator n=1 Tax=unclassified Colwellia TaxID=196834 RepID=UPI0008788213|nr:MULTISPECIES: TetR/AcrR family transcriptional regulator [unclassified Colwellia]MBA6362574.1 TetR/AcrR family transcriptional regulator [Colwellia sp. BRX8-8]AOW78415.1 TetR family transcriptional regulator [Colwellia sp. PAMC 20917]MBA6253346.1 TetR/AcrR family transcriptional regulator [Colwellia sp. MB3u-55]MBA6336230.1 TetR/AcrR family transcriptional regulator [Colwellia sp. BRX8-7]MBA6349300.1 TetR/AcrR family transcriptional regulator [Colwellia sp. BRX8-9]|tara:strand:- start:1620 stop:2240 length:621 start_codon:yes stop_codon:yes gene_type:complete